MIPSSERQHGAVPAPPPCRAATGGPEIGANTSIMIAFITGATGFLGGVVARQLVDAGHVVRAVVRHPSRATALRELGVETFPGDVTEPNTLRAPMIGADAVVHVAGWYKIGVRDRHQAQAVNVDGTRHVLGMMRELGVPKGVYTSTLAINSDTHGRVVDETYRFAGRHVSVYDRTKAEAHHVAEAFIAAGLPLVIVQPGLIYGPGDTSGVRTTFIQFLQRKLPVIPRGTAFCWAHVEDVARGHLLALERGQIGRNYFLAGPVHTLVDALDRAAEITGVPAPKVRAPPSMLRAAAIAVRPLELILPLPPAYTSEGLRVIGGVTYLGSHERATRELDWHPRPLREGLTDTLRHEMQQLGMTPAF